jgi:hypothetical protein
MDPQAGSRVLVPLLAGRHQLPADSPKSGTQEALVGPTAFGMIPVLFPDSRERVR